MKELPPSHKVSYLKLIPKVGKDLSRLTNWRPISLSNCDHKLITKTLAKKLCDVVADKISQNQTAYIKGRLINDNLRAMIATLNIANLEETARGLLVALDAKKAFDSVSHEYIRKCLERFGCRRFVHIFDVLYKDLRTDIIINGRIVRGFNINRGVKQGDALSCIIFIMCMEPLLRNLERNAMVRPIFSNQLGNNLPAVYGYADDFNLVIRNDANSLKMVFLEYERLTKLSGLELNADKTEIMRLGMEQDELTFEVEYMGIKVKIRTQKKAKINGIIFQNNVEEMVDENVTAALSRADRHFRNWSKRSLSMLGKILICKTFGISQIIYLMQTITLKECHKTYKCPVV
jgi:hypothetical protein